MPASWEGKGKKAEASAFPGTTWAVLVPLEELPQVWGGAEAFAKE